MGAVLANRYVNSVMVYLCVELQPNLGGTVEGTVVHFQLPTIRPDEKSHNA